MYPKQCSYIKADNQYTLSDNWWLPYA